MKLWEYVLASSVRGACTCGKCIDGVPNPEDHQPPDDPAHTVDLTFFKVARIEGADAGYFRELVEQEFPHWLDGSEHSYLQIGGDIGDQGLALQCMGLGHVLGVWRVMSPETLFGPDYDHDLKLRMAGAGYVTLQSLREAPAVVLGDA